MSESAKRSQVFGLVVGAVLTIAITSFHYLTDSHAVEFHNVYRRLYYIPILILAFSRGLPGGLIGALVVSVAYIPHAFLSHHADPAPTIDKVLEIVLYLVVGGLTGWLVGRQQKAQRALEREVEAREALERQLVRAGRLSALGQLTSGLAHEIRNPLASILGSAEALATEFGPEHRKHRMAQLLLKEINRLGRVVNDFLRFARPGSAERVRVDFSELAREVVELTSMQAESAGVQVGVSIEPGVAVVDADRTQMAQVLLNILLNAYQAIEATRGGEDPIVGRVSILSQRRTIAGAGYLCVGVEDNGPGIAPEQIEDVFNPYFTTRVEGTGLGLSISSRIVESHGGFVDIESEAGRTVVWICLEDGAESEGGGHR